MFLPYFVCSKFIGQNDFLWRIIRENAIYFSLLFEKDIYLAQEVMMEIACHCKQMSIKIGKGFFPSQGHFNTSSCKTNNKVFASKPFIPYPFLSNNSLGKSNAFYALKPVVSQIKMR
jgi:hypothetical protein